ncbi:MAG: alpha/beta fold hydrolase [Candidatus Gastranaerophilales bacterium]|nr:alpha/beta fold hydrolase [Candidatus Gastranaerophilales bacterium]
MLSNSDKPIPDDVNINEISILTRDNLNVSVKYYIPPTEGEKPAVILLHMLGKDKSSWNKFIPKLLENGYAVFNIDMRGHGRSTRIQDGHEIFYTNMNESDWKKLPDDVNDVINFIKNEKFIDKNKIAVMGASIGANSAIIEVSKHPDYIKAVIALSPGLNYHGILTYEAAKDLRIPLLIAVSQGDMYSFESSNQLNKVVKNSHDLLIYKGADHGTNLLNKYEDLENKVVSWLNENLRDKK